MFKARSAAARCLEQAQAQRQRARYVLRLYVNGMTPCSLRAIQNLQAICDEFLRGRYRLEITDLGQHPELVRRDQIVAAPTLLKKSPLPLRRLVGDLSIRERVLVGLDLKPQTAS